MTYKVIITDYANQLLDNLINHLLHHFKNKQAATHLLSEMYQLFTRLEENPKQFPICKDNYLASKGYCEAIVGDMNYLVIFSVQQDIVYIMGIFHQLEAYSNKL